MKVRDFMRTEVVTLTVGDHLEIADDIMRLGRVRHLPVQDGSRVVGIVSERDLYRAGMSSVLELEPGSNRDWLAKVAVRDVMTEKLETVGPDDDMRTVVQRLLEKKIGCVLVVENEALVGLVSETDCLSYLDQILRSSDVRRALPDLGID